MSTLAAIVLAAGASRRMGRPKLLLRLADGRTLLGSSIRACLDAGLSRVAVVLGASADAMIASGEIPADPRVRVVVNDRWGEGMAGSLRAGLAACAEAPAVLVTLADLAGQTAERVGRVVAAWTSEAPLVVPVTSQGRATHPVVFGRCLWEELRALAGDTGAREVVRRHAGRAIRLELPPLLDVDTEEDYRDVMKGRPPAGPGGLELP